MSTTENLGIKRQATLFKKAHHLSVLCDAEVAVIAFTRDGKLHEFSSTTMEHTLSRYKGNAEQPKPGERRRRQPTKTEEPKQCDHENHVLEELKGQHAALSLEKSRRMGKELDGLSGEELCALEEQQLLALLAVNNKKKELIVEMLQRSMSHNEQGAVLQEKNLIGGLEGRMMEGPYVLQDHGLNGMDFDTKSDAVSVHNRPSEDSNEHSEILQLRL
ncbi:hypothetical protein ACLB2K_062781 [Fragaria x ananassa]